ncbi:MAG: hypothetical protein HQM15_10420 [Deltaproteobacteria bacterium]|nr:hypothetical protein [Deltaproteobacteria bacterium]
MGHTTVQQNRFSEGTSFQSETGGSFSELGVQVRELSNQVALSLSSNFAQRPLVSTTLMGLMAGVLTGAPSVFHSRPLNSDLMHSLVQELARLVPLCFEQCRQNTELRFSVVLFQALESTSHPLSSREREISQLLQLYLRSPSGRALLALCEQALQQNWTDQQLNAAFVRSQYQGFDVHNLTQTLVTGLSYVLGDHSVSNRNILSSSYHRFLGTEEDTGANFARVILSAYRPNELSSDLRSYVERQGVISGIAQTASFSGIASSWSGHLLSTALIALISRGPGSLTMKIGSAMLCGAASSLGQVGFQFYWATRNLSSQDRMTYLRGMDWDLKSALVTGMFCGVSELFGAELLGSSTNFISQALRTFANFAIFNVGGEMASDAVMNRIGLAAGYVNPNQGDVLGPQSFIGQWVLGAGQELIGDHTAEAPGHLIHLSMTGVHLGLTALAVRSAAPLQTADSTLSNTHVGAIHELPLLGEINSSMRALFSRLLLAAIPTPALGLAGLSLTLSQFLNPETAHAISQTASAAASTGQSLGGLALLGAIFVAMGAMVKGANPKSRRNVKCSAQFVSEINDRNLDARLRLQALETICRYLEGETLPGDNLEKMSNREAWTLRVDDNYRLLIVRDKEGNSIFIDIDNHKAIDRRVQRNELGYGKLADEAVLQGFLDELNAVKEREAAAQRISFPPDLGSVALPPAFEASAGGSDTAAPVLDTGASVVLEGEQALLPSVPAPDPVAAEVISKEDPLDETALITELNSYWELELLRAEAAERIEKDFAALATNPIALKLVSLELLLRGYKIQEVGKEVCEEIAVYVHCLESHNVWGHANHVLNLYRNIRESLVKKIPVSQKLRSLPELHTTEEGNALPSIEVARERALALLNSARERGVISSEPAYAEIVRQAAKKGSPWQVVLEQAEALYLRNRDQILKSAKSLESLEIAIPEVDRAEILKQEKADLLRDYIELELIAAPDLLPARANSILNEQVRALCPLDKPHLKERLESFWKHPSLYFLLKLLVVLQTSSLQEVEKTSPKLRKLSQELTLVTRELSLRAMAGQNLQVLVNEACKRTRVLYENARAEILNVLLSSTTTAEQICEACTELSPVVIQNPWPYLVTPTPPTSPQYLRFPEWKFVAQIHRLYQARATVEELAAFEARLFSFVTRGFKEGITYSALRDLLEADCRYLALRYLKDRADFLKREVHVVEAPEIEVGDEELNAAFFEFLEIEPCQRNAHTELELLRGLRRFQDRLHATEAILFYGGNRALIGIAELQKLQTTIESGRAYSIPEQDIHIPAESGEEVQALLLTPFNVALQDAPAITFYMMNIAGATGATYAKQFIQKEVNPVLLWMSWMILSGFDRAWVKSKASQLLVDRYNACREDIFQRIDWLRVVADKAELRAENAGGVYGPSQDIFHCLCDFLLAANLKGLEREFPEETNYLLKILTFHSRKGSRRELPSLRHQRQFARIYLELRSRILASMPAVQLQK